jgi:hypothetical protein
MEPINHIKSHVELMNQFYEWPKTRSEYNIFFKEVFRLPDFWPEMFKKYFNSPLNSLGLLSASYLELVMWV